MFLVPLLRNRNALEIAQSLLIYFTYYNNFLERILTITQLSEIISNTINESFCVSITSRFNTDYVIITFTFHIDQLDL